eukprot:GHVT01096461.1.p1 GENE.GHVT01096461.1~~GHVT01096461.1.p1  ORF type:complete len:139 (-),score=26.38 GHVT01096461.1:788-1204(-)
MGPRRDGAWFPRGGEPGGRPPRFGVAAAVRRARKGPSVTNGAPRQEAGSHELARKFLRLAEPPPARCRPLPPSRACKARDRPVTSGAFLVLGARRPRPSVPSYSWLGAQRSSSAANAVYHVAQTPGHAQSRRPHSLTA